MISKKLLECLKFLTSRISFLSTVKHFYKTTKTFFHLTYKKYRFNFELYQKCKDSDGCNVPAAAVRSHNLSFCICYEKNFFKAIIEQQEAYPKLREEKKKVSESILIQCNQAAKDSLEKDIFSRHLGVSYRTTSVFTDKAWTKNFKDKQKIPVYRKIINEFSISDNYKTRTLKRQAQYHERNL